MKYLCLACGDESAWEGLTEAQQQEIVAKCRVHDEKLAADPRVSLYVGLSEGGRLIRQENGERVVTDGPFIESKEIGGVFVVEADDIDEATELASMHPAGQMGEELGWYVVVRPVFVPELEAVQATH
ncbi:MAG: YciI family protein [Gemmatimonadota bacterium]